MTNTTPGVITEQDNNGSIRTEQNPRWIRGRVGRTTVVDSRDSLFVWEVPYYPQWYFPVTDLNAELKRTDTTKTTDHLGTATICDLLLPDDDGTVLERAAFVYEDCPADELRDRVRIRWDAIDTWLEEEVEVTVHPRSPYTRVDVLPSSRRVIVSVDGVAIADSPRPHILYETGLPPRYYLPMTDVRTDLLVETALRTACPYKGVARYWNVTVDGVIHENLVWGYDDPLPESALVKGLVCFYNEKVDITVDGKPLARPNTKFS